MFSDSPTSSSLDVSGLWVAVTTFRNARLSFATSRGERLTSTRHSILILYVREFCWSWLPDLMTLLSFRRLGWKSPQPRVATRLSIQPHLQARFTPKFRTSRCPARARVRMTAHDAPRDVSDMTGTLSPGRVCERSSSCEEAIASPPERGSSPVSGFRDPWPVLPSRRRPAGVPALPAFFAASARGGRLLSDSPASCSRFASFVVSSADDEHAGGR